MQYIAVIAGVMAKWCWKHHNVTPLNSLPISSTSSLPPPNFPKCIIAQSYQSLTTPLINM